LVAVETGEELKLQLYIGQDIIGVAIHLEPFKIFEWGLSAVILMLSAT
jgi:hypothetical protein